MCYELKKLIASKITWISFAVVLLAMTPVVRQAIREETVDLKPYEEYIEEMTGQYEGEELVEELLLKQNEAFALANSGQSVPKLAVYSYVYSRAAYTYVTFPNNREDLVMDSLYDIDEEEKAGKTDSDLIRQSNYEIAMYNRKIDMPLVHPGRDMFYSLFNCNMWDYVFLAFLVMITVRILTIDRTTGAYQTMLPVARRPKRIFCNQMATAVLVGTVALAIQAIAELVCAMLFYGVRRFDAPIQVFSSMEMCPYLITIGEFFLIKFLLKVFLVIVMVCVVALITMLTKYTAVAMGIGLVVAVAPQAVLFSLARYLGGGFHGPQEWQYKLYHGLRACVVQGFTDAKAYLDNLDAISIFGVYTSRIWVALGVGAVVGVGCFVGAMLLYGRPSRQISHLRVAEGEQ